METPSDIMCILIKPYNINGLSWFDSNYPQQIAELNIYDEIIINQENFIEILATKLNISDVDIKNVCVKTEVIAEEPYYIYELLYIDLVDHKKYHNQTIFNGVASLLNTNGDDIYYNALLFKNYLPSLTNSMNLISITKSDIKNILHSRVNTKIVIWDIENQWQEIEVIGDLTIFAKTFFEDSDYKKIEMGFLLHNINIWYLEDIYSEKTNTYTRICGNLLNKPLEKCLWFLLKSDDIRGNLTLNEVNKIIHLSNKLKSYKTPSEFLEETFDNLGRKIINNKYKVLDYLYNQTIT